MAVDKRDMFAENREDMRVLPPDIQRGMESSLLPSLTGDFRSVSVMPELQKLNSGQQIRFREDFDAARTELTGQSLRDMSIAPQQGGGDSLFGALCTELTKDVNELLDHFDAAADPQQPAPAPANKLSAPVPQQPSVTPFGL